MATIVDLVPGGNVEKFFRTNRPVIILDLIKSYGLTREEAEDCFQEGSIALFKQVQEGKLTPENLTARLSSYLNRCCRNYATHILQKAGRNAPDLPDEHGLAKFMDSSSEGKNNKAYEELLLKMEEVVKDLPEPCNTILWSTYYDFYEDKVLAEMLNYTLASFRVTKSRCTKKLKTRMNSIIEEYKS